MDNWISVNDRLPDNDSFVLVSISGKYKNTTFSAAFELACYTESEGWIVEAYPEWTNPNVTHWQPLPEPPKV